MPQHQDVHRDTDGIGSERVSTIWQLCQSSIIAGIKRLTEIGTWPRPPAAKRLRLGYDFYWNDLLDIPEVEDLVKYLASDDRLKSIYSRDSEFLGSWIQLLLNILFETQRTSPSKQTIEKWFRRFVKELYSETALWRTVHTVTGLTLEGATFRLDNATTLTSVPGYDLHRLIWGQERHFSGDRFLDDGWTAVLNNDKATLVTTVRIAKCEYWGDHPYPHLLRDIERSSALMYAVRLTKPGSPRLHGYALFHLSRFPLSEPMAHCSIDSELGPNERPTVLSKGDLNKVRNLWRELMETRYQESPRVSGPDDLDIPLWRFSSTYGHRSWMEDMVDLTISLESLFGPDDRQELSHRVASRTAWLLGNEPYDGGGGSVYERVKTMYDIRSRVVHGARRVKKNKIIKWTETLTGKQYDAYKHGYNPPGKLVDEVIESARDVVRRSIRACMALHKLGGKGPHWPFPKKFDEDLLVSKKQRVWQKAAGVIR